MNEPAPFRTLLRSGFATGALVYGSVIGLLHVAHNRLGSVRDAVVLGAWTAVFFGLWMLAAFVVGALPAWLAGRRAIHPDQKSSCDARWWGLLLFHLAFWELFFLHGITYDHYPFGTLHSVWGMLGFLAVCALLILLGALILTELLFRLVRRAGRDTVVALAVVFVLAHALLALHYRGATSPSPAPDAGAAARAAAIHPADTGLRVMMVDLDGADWRVIQPLIEKGELPHFAEIVRRGTTGPLPTIKDSNSAVIWASIFTGKRPEQHQVLDFYRIHLPGMAGNGVYPVHRTFFKEIADLLTHVRLAEFNTVSRGELHALPLWEILDHLGVSIGIVDGFYYSFPALTPTTAGGYCVSYGTNLFYDQLVHEPGAARLGDAKLFVQPEDVFRTIKPFLEQPDFAWQSAALAKLFADRPQPRYVNLYSHEPDSVQHWFWKWYQPELFLNVRADDLARWGDEIPKRYRSFDAFLGTLLEKVDEKTVLLVVSDHGHSPTILHQSYYSQHRHGPPGIFLAVGGPVRAGQKLGPDASIYDVFPTVLHLLGLPVPQDGTGRVLQPILQPDFLLAHPPATIPTYDGLWQSPHAPGVASGLNQEELQKLKSLGYL
jgi:hypothetical protein